MIKTITKTNKKKLQQFRDSFSCFVATEVTGPWSFPQPSLSPKWTEDELASLIRLLTQLKGVGFFLSLCFPFFATNGVECCGESRATQWLWIGIVQFIFIFGIWINRKSFINKRLTHVGGLIFIAAGTTGVLLITTCRKLSAEPLSPLWKPQ